ncbi:MAG: viral A-type inclusion protein [Bacteroidota bacterium]
MKKVALPFICLFLIVYTSCNNESKNAQPETSPKTAADSLMHDVMDGHNEAMAKMGKLNRMELEVQNIIDSIEKLPAKAKAALSSYKIKLDTALVHLRSAKEGMDKWMDNFNMDSAITNMEQRVKYLTDEKLKVSTVKESILSSLAKADSLIKSKF